MQSQQSHNVCGHRHLLKVDMQVSSLPVQPSTLVTNDVGRCHHRGVTRAKRSSVSCQHNAFCREARHIPQHLVWSSLHKSRQTQRKHKRPRVTVQASSSNRQRKTREIPIFPLGMVALPGAVTPLNIFEARYGVDTYSPADSADEPAANRQGTYAGTEFCSAHFWLATMGESSLLLLSD